MSGAGCDLRDIEAAAAAGQRAGRAGHRCLRRRRSATTSAPTSLELGGADAIVFTGGIGENSVRIRTGVCRDLDWFGIALDPALERRPARPSGGLDAPVRACRSGPCRPTRRSWSPGQSQATCCSEQQLID